jgi:two-component system, OmpR family, osmolarity sensor histidine kinase EnvZ
MLVIKNYLPRSLLGRTLLIIVTPLLIVQIVSTYIFYGNHWDTVRWRLSSNLAGEIAVLVGGLRAFPDPAHQQWFLVDAATAMRLTARFEPGAILPNEAPRATGSMHRTLERALQGHLTKPFRIDTESLAQFILVDVQLPEGVLRLTVNKKQVFSTTTYVFLLWMVGTSMILLGIAAVFMHNQIRPVLRLASAAEAFGKGRDVPAFKPQGAKEVRQAAAAFIAMRQRIFRQISQRTALLSGVSHDLRTPLTRMKLQLEMMGSDDGIVALKEDVTEMERMLDGYLSFARGEGSEKPQQADVSILLEESVRQARRKGGEISFRTEAGLRVAVRPFAFQRCVTNLLDNAMRYGRHVSVQAGRWRERIEVIVDDDGPGIAEDRREDAFKPFYRLESSRNPATGGIGLGLSIARDVARSHGGDIVLGESPLGGLRARIWLPI